MKRYIRSGIHPADSSDRYVIDYTYSYPDDIIDIVPPQLYRSEHGNNIYWFGYKFNDDISSKDRTAFINYIKGLSETKIPERDLEHLIELPLAALNESINLYAIDCFVYPGSKRSQLVSKMIHIINRFTSREMNRLSFELVKSVPTEIEFDWKLFRSDNGDDINRYNMMKQYVDETLMPMIHALDYFSLAHSVKPKYRKYIKNYLSFKDEDIEEFSGLKGKNILIVDDINTSGATIDEILRVIEKLNKSCNIYIYTLIGK